MKNSHGGRAEREWPGHWCHRYRPDVAGHSHVHHQPARSIQRLSLSAFPERRVGTLFLSFPPNYRRVTTSRGELPPRRGFTHRTRDRLLGSSPPRSAGSG